jgi:CII-binding regulator of phage lambda lysogenization HflD
MVNGLGGSRPFYPHNLVTTEDVTGSLIAKLARVYRQIIAELGQKEIVLRSSALKNAGKPPLKRRMTVWLRRNIREGQEALPTA